jgi:DNA repair protein RadC
LASKAARYENKNRVNGFKVVSTGSLTASRVDPREYGGASHMGAAVVFVHNHPTGAPTVFAKSLLLTRYAIGQKPLFREES